MSAPTPEQIALAVREMRERAKHHRCSAKTWARINSRYNRDLDNKLADALEVVALHIGAVPQPQTQGGVDG